MPFELQGDGQPSPFSAPTRLAATRSPLLVAKTVKALPSQKACLGCSLESQPAPFVSCELSSFRRPPRRRDKVPHLLVVLFSGRDFHPAGNIHPKRFRGADGGGDVLRRQSTGQEDRLVKLFCRRGQRPVESPPGPARLPLHLAVEQKGIRVDRRTAPPARRRRGCERP
jgi:hypothetical protein